MREYGCLRHPDTEHPGYDGDDTLLDSSLGRGELLQRRLRGAGVIQGCVGRGGYSRAWGEKRVTLTRDVKAKKTHFFL